MTLAAVGALAETADGEQRVCLTPDVVGHLTRLGLRVLVEQGAGRRASFQDADYLASGAEVLPRATVVSEGAVLLSLHTPEVGLLHEGQGAPRGRL